jgi:hypothetical protein
MLIEVLVYQFHVVPHPFHIIKEDVAGNFRIAHGPFLDEVQEYVG